MQSHIPIHGGRGPLQAEPVKQNRIFAWPRDPPGGGAVRCPALRLVREIVAVPSRVEGDVIEIADICTTRDRQLVRADGFPPHVDRFERAGYDIAALLAQDD